MAPHSFPFRPTHIVRVLPLHRALALLLVEQGNLLGLQSCDGLRPMILGIEMDLLNLEEETQVVILRVWECQSLLPSISTERLHCSLCGSITMKAVGSPGSEFGNSLL